MSQSATTAKTKPAAISATQRADAQHDLQGIWDFSTITPLERPKELAGKEFFTKQEAADWARKTQERSDYDRRDGGNQRNLERGYNEYWVERGQLIGTMRTSLIIDPPDGRLPAMSDEGRERLSATTARIRGHEFDSAENRQLPDRCLKLQGAGPPINPTIYNNNVRITEGPGYVVILHEMNHEARVVLLDGRPHAPEQIRLWNGDSRGHWEGDTLVVETTNFRDRSVFPATETARGPFYESTEKMRLIERFERLDKDTLRYRFTVDDPGRFTKPWTAEIPAKRSAGPLLEYGCQEGNADNMTLVLSGARADERKGQEFKK